MSALKALPTIAVIGLSTLVLTALPAMAQQKLCGEYATISKALKENLGQNVVGTGLIDNRIAMLFLTSPGGETWTILTVAPNGMTCFEGMGNSWSGFADAPKGPSF